MAESPQSAKYPFTIHVIRARNMPCDTAVFEKRFADPYCQVTIDEHRQIGKTQVINNEANPEWNATIHAFLDTHQSGQQITFTILDDNSLSFVCEPEYDGRVVTLPVKLKETTRSKSKHEVYRGPASIDICVERYVSRRDFIGLSRELQALKELVLGRVADDDDAKDEPLMPLPLKEQVRSLHSEHNELKQKVKRHGMGMQMIPTLQKNHKDLEERVFGKEKLKADDDEDDGARKLNKPIPLLRQIKDNRGKIYALEKRQSAFKQNVDAFSQQMKSAVDVLSSSQT